jgi:hypothetical protein
VLWSYKHSSSGAVEFSAFDTADSAVVGEHDQFREKGNQIVLSKNNTCLLDFNAKTLPAVQTSQRKCDAKGVFSEKCQLCSEAQQVLSAKIAMALVGLSSVPSLSTGDPVRTRLSAAMQRNWEI